MRTFFRKWFCRRSERIHEFFSNATRVYILQGDEDARLAALAVAGMAGARQRKALTRELENIAANISQSYPDKTRRKMLAERVLSLKESIESSASKQGADGEEKKKLLFLNKEYFSSLNEGDPSVFCRRYPKLF